MSHENGTSKKGKGRAPSDEEDDDVDMGSGAGSDDEEEKLTPEELMKRKRETRANYRQLAADLEG